MNTMGIYEFVIEGAVTESAMVWFDDMEVRDEGEQTRIRARVADQAALHGIIGRIRDLGLRLVGIERIAQ